MTSSDKLPVATPEEFALLEAAKVGDEDKVRQLLSSGVNPDARDNRDLPWNVTPLMYAAEGGHLKVMECLLEAGADINARDAGIPGHAPGLGTALIYAIYAQEEQAAMYLLEKGAAYNGKYGGNTSLGMAAYRNAPNVVNALLKKGADPNIKNSHKRTPLHQAADEGHTKITEMLLKAGADIHALNELGKTPLHTAVAARHTAVVKVLLNAGSDVNRQDKIGETPLLWSACTNDTEIVKMLLDAGADPNYLDNEGNTALDFAIRFEQGKVAELIRKHGGLTSVELDSSGNSNQRRMRPKMNSSEENPRLCTRAVKKWAKKISETYGLSPRKEAEMRESILFKIPRQEAERIAAKHSVNALKEGVYIFASNNHLVVFPGTDKFNVIKRMGTNGDNYGITTAQIVRVLKRIDKQYPFRVTGIGYDFISGVFTTEIKTPMRLAKALYRICPDLVDQGSGTLEIASSELKKTKRLFLWWD